MPEVIFKYNNQKINLAQKQDVINPNLAYENVVNNNSSQIFGTTKEASINADSNNFFYAKIKLDASISKGDVFTISALGTLSGQQAGDGSYHVAVYTSDASARFDTDSNYLKSGTRTSKTFTATANSSAQPYLFIYPGVPGKTANNSLEIKEIKVERGSVATPYMLSIKDQVLKSDFDSIISRITKLESKMGG